MIARQRYNMKRLRRLSYLDKSILLMCFLYSLFIFYFYILAQKLQDSEKLKQTGLAKFRSKPLINTDCSEWDEFITCNKLWHGDALFYFTLPSDLQLTIVISHCDESIPMNTFEKYFKHAKGKIKKIYIRDCPQSNSADHSIAKWLEENRNQLIESSTGEDENSHIILFLNSPSIQNQNRRLLHVLQATIQNGFGCVTKPMEPHHSIYHSTEVLRSYRSISHDHNPTYSNFGDWLDEVNIKLDTYTPVCYESSFAIRASDISTKIDILLSISNNLANHSDSEVHGFAERTWGGIFSYKLKSNNIAALRNHTYRIISETCGLTGSLVSDYTKHLIPLWRGQSFFEVDSLRISVVISYCKEGLEWVDEFIKHTSLQDLTILSKCDEEVRGLEYGPVIIKEMPMPKSRSLYHPFARYMSQMTETEDAENHIVVFLSAAQMSGDPVSLKQMVKSASNLGYACSYKHTGKSSIFYDTNTLKKSTTSWSFALTFGQWLDNNEIYLPHPITPYCSSDHFATKASNIIKQKETWAKLEKLETYGNDAKLVKQTWAGLLLIR